MHSRQIIRCNSELGVLLGDDDLLGGIGSRGASRGEENTGESQARIGAMGLDMRVTSDR